VSDAPWCSHGEHPGRDRLQGFTNQQHQPTPPLRSWCRVLTEMSAGESRLPSLKLIYLRDAFYLCIVNDCLYSYIIIAVNNGWISVPRRRALILDKLGNVPLLVWRQEFSFSFCFLFLHVFKS